jgi:hypothetical protein
MLTNVFALHSLPAQPASKPKRRLPQDSGPWRSDRRDRSGQHFGDAINRWLCWAFALSGAALFRLTVYLSRHGILTRRQSFGLLCWSTRLHRIAVRLLRSGRW